MKNNQNTLKILLDTSFILPTLGIDVGHKVQKALERLYQIRADIYYSRFSLLEASWLALRLQSRGVLNFGRFEEGLRSILESKRYMEAPIDASVFMEALKLWELGHKDIIDNILYATTILYDLKLLTIDETLKFFIERIGLKNTLIFPDALEKFA